MNITDIEAYKNNKSRFILIFGVIIPFIYLLTALIGLISQNKILANNLIEATPLPLLFYVGAKKFPGVVAVYNFLIAFCALAIFFLWFVIIKKPRLWFLERYRIFINFLFGLIAGLSLFLAIVQIPGLISLIPGLLWLQFIIASEVNLAQVLLILLVYIAIILVPGLMLLVATIFFWDLKELIKDEPDKEIFFYIGAGTSFLLMPLFYYGSFLYG